MCWSSRGDVIGPGSLMLPILLSKLRNPLVFLSFVWTLGVTWFGGVNLVHAGALHAPAGGMPVPLPEDRVLCERIRGTWRLEPGGTSVRPPATAEPGEQSTVKVARTYGE